MAASEHLSPQQFFHGTSKALARQIEKSGPSEGTHLTTNPDAARQYARYASGGSAWTEAKSKQGVVLAITAHAHELRRGSYGDDSFVRDHNVTTTNLGPERVRRTEA